MHTDKKITKLLLQFSAICSALLFYRIFKTGYLTYLFMLWNLFLAWIPYLISAYSITKKNERKILEKETPLLLTWLLFLPNSPYIITDLVHMGTRGDEGFWFNLLLILSFAFTGLLLFMFSINHITDKVLHNQKLFIKKTILYAVFFLCGYGLYLGRLLRFNSWDIVTDPMQLAGAIYESLFNPLWMKETLGVSCLFALFLYFGYKAFIGIASLKTLRKNEPEIFN